MAICVIAVVAVAPCQCFSPGGNQTTSPGRISSTGPPQRCAQPQPSATINVWPNGCVCHAVRAPGSKLTQAPTTRAGAGASISRSIRAAPVNQSADPCSGGREPLRLISIRFLLAVVDGCLGSVVHALKSTSGIAACISFYAGNGNLRYDNPAASNESAV